MEARVMAKISTSYGRPAEINGHPTAFLYGSGYGKDAELAAHADRAAVLLSEAFGLEVEKRGNSDGKSAGAHYDGEYGVGLGAWKNDDGTVRFDASFHARVKDAERILAEVPNRGGYRLEKQDRDFARRMGDKVTSVTVYSPNFAALEAAFEWLKEYGVKFCPALKPAPAPRIEDPLAKKPCPKCGKVFNVNDDIRLVNAARGYQLPEPEYCTTCLQVKAKVSA
jgi:hypothetical protein